MLPSPCGWCSTIFLSTPSVRRATRGVLRPEVAEDYFYPRPPCGGRPVRTAATIARAQDFYPRPPCGGRRRSQRSGDIPRTYFYPRPPCGGRLLELLAEVITLLFLSTPSVRRATRSPFLAYVRDLISIHALRAEGDGFSAGRDRVVRDFYPRPPCGGRPRGHGEFMQVIEFLSTPSVRRATNVGATCGGQR